MTSLEDPTKVTHRPGGYLLAPQGEEYLGDVSNVVFSNGVIVRENGDVYIYYGSSDTRVHVATTTRERLLDYVLNTPEDGERSRITTEQRIFLIDKNIEYAKEQKRDELLKRVSEADFRTLS